MTLAEFINDSKQNHALCMEATYHANLKICTGWIIKSFAKSPEEARDLFIEAMVILSENNFKNRIQPTETLVSTYLLAICKNLIRQSDRDKRFQEVTIENLPENLVVEEFEAFAFGDETQLKSLQDSLEKLGHPCNTIIREFYFNQTRQEKLTEMLGYQNVDVTKTMKYKCLGRLKDIFFKMYKQS